MRCWSRVARHVLGVSGVGPAIALALALAGQGGEVVAARPTFFFLPDYARKLGCTVVEVPLDDGMAHDLDQMAAAVNPSVMEGSCHWESS